MSIDPMARARTMRFERCETRLVLSAESLTTLIEPIDSDYVSEWVTTENVETLEPAASLSEIDLIQETYGLTGSGQTVAVIDTGIAWDHDALGAGYGEDYRVVGGWDFAEDDADPYDDGPAGLHGTHVSGIIGSSDETYEGLAPEVDLVALRVFDDFGYASLSWVEEALQWVYDNRYSFENPITTVNLSIGTDWNSDTVPDWSILEDEFALLEESGLFISVAAGNSYQTYQTTGVSYPAASPYVVPVASVGADGQLSDFSQRNEEVIAAPGESIVSTVPNYVFGSSQPSDQFLALSGTSMAAPYVAGASVLLREAMQIAGYESIDQSALEQVFRETADEIWDAETNATYLRVNLENAIASVLDDQIGDTADSASDLGILSTTHSLAGVIETIDDIDAYRFTASNSGTVQLQIGSSEGFRPVVTVGSQTVLTSGSTAEFDVVAGQSYVVHVATQAGIGQYELELTTISDSIETIDLGIIENETLTNMPLDESVLLRTVAQRNGVMTYLVTDAALGDGLSINVYDAEMQLAHNGRDIADGQRISFNVSEGDVYYLQIEGSASTFTLQALNQISQNGDSLVIHSLESDDIYSVRVGDDLLVEVNGVRYRYDAERFDRVVVAGGAGVDSIEVALSGSQGAVSITDGSMKIDVGGLRIVTDAVENVYLTGGSEADSLRLVDNLGHLTFDATHDQAEIVTGGQAILANGFETIRIFANGDTDRVSLQGTEETEKLIGHSDRLIFTSAGSDIRIYGAESMSVEGFDETDQVVLWASANGTEVNIVGDQIAVLHSGSHYSITGSTDVRFRGSTGNDVANLYAADSSQVWSTTGSRYWIEELDFQVRIYGFEHVRMHSNLIVDSAMVPESLSESTPEPIGRAQWSMQYSSDQSRIDQLGSVKVVEVRQASEDDAVLDAAWNFGVGDRAAQLTWTPGSDDVFHQTSETRSFHDFVEIGTPKNVADGKEASLLDQIEANSELDQVGADVDSGDRPPTLFEADVDHRAESLVQTIANEIDEQLALDSYFDSLGEQW